MFTLYTWLCGIPEAFYRETIYVSKEIEEGNAVSHFEVIYK